MAWLAIAAAGGAVMFGRDLLSSLAAERFPLWLRDKVFRHVQSLSPDFFAARDSGDLVARITRDIDAVEGLVVSGVVQAVSGFVTSHQSPAAIRPRLQPADSRSPLSTTAVAEAAAAPSRSGMRASTATRTGPLLSNDLRISANSCLIASCRIIA